MTTSPRYAPVTEMDRNETRYRVVSTLLQADEPLSLAEITHKCGVEATDARSVLAELITQGQVVAGSLVLDKPTPQYGWAARWEQRAQRRTVSVQQGLRAALETVKRVPEHELDVDSQPSSAFHDYVLHEYSPPQDKQFLVFLQGSVRRPFSVAPSHAAMRRAIRVATGYDPSPSKDFENCPVHVVVLASKIGPVPYELEDLYPANVRGGGVKHFDWRRYQRVKPVLAERIAQYLITFRDHYTRVATFTEGRYAEVMQTAQESVAVQSGQATGFPILPKIGGPSIARMGNSTPHQYWARYWIQLYLEIVSWLTPEQQAQAEARLHKLKVNVRGQGPIEAGRRGDN